MQLKTVHKMLSEGRVKDLASYIKSGGDVRGAFLLIVADELSQYGVPVHSLQDRSVIRSMPTLIQCMKTELLKGTITTESKAALKHYIFVLRKAMTLWKSNQLDIKCRELDEEFDNRVRNHLHTVWRNYNTQSIGSDHPFVRHMEEAINSHMEILVRSAKVGKACDQVSNGQIKLYNGLLANKMLEAWKNKSDVSFDNIRGYLDEKLKDVLLVLVRKKGGLGAIMMSEIGVELKKCLWKISKTKDPRYPGLIEKYRCIYRGFQDRDKDNFDKDFTEETLGIMVESCYSFDKQAAADLDNLMRDSILPNFIAMEFIEVNLRHEIILSAIHAQQIDKNVAFRIGDDIQKLFNTVIADEVCSEIRNEAGLFKDIVGQRIREVVNAYKLKNEKVVRMLPEIDGLFADMQDLILQGEGKVDSLSQMQRMCDQMREMSDRLKAMSDRIVVLESANAEFVQSAVQKKSDGAGTSNSAVQAKEPSARFFHK